MSLILAIRSKWSDTEICNRVVNGQVVSQVFSIWSVVQDLKSGAIVYRLFLSLSLSIYLSLFVFGPFLQTQSDLSKTQSYIKSGVHPALGLADNGICSSILIISIFFKTAFPYLGNCLTPFWFSEVWIQPTLICTTKPYLVSVGSYNSFIPPSLYVFILALLSWQAQAFFVMNLIFKMHRRRKVSKFIKRLDFLIRSTTLTFLMPTILSFWIIWDSPDNLSGLSGHFSSF